MMLRIAGCLAILCMANFGHAQQTSLDAATTSCTFQDGKQMSVRYNNEPTDGKNHLPEGKVWSPGGTPMFFFTQADLLVGNTNIPTGAYSLYVIPQRDNWTLVLNKNVSPGSKYDEHQDLLRASMQSGHLSEPQPFGVLFGHIAAKQCNMRIYDGKIGTWAEFKEK